MNKIILTAEANLEDKEAREYIKILESRIDKINERTKIHTIELRKLNKKRNKQWIKKIQ